MLILVQKPFVLNMVLGLNFLWNEVALPLCILFWCATLFFPCSPLMNLLPKRTRERIWSNARCYYILAMIVNIWVLVHVLVTTRGYDLSRG